MGETAYHQYQRDRWACSACGGRIVFYDYTCDTCGRYEIISG
jgi:hypothetical protein